MAFNFAHLLSAACGGAARRLRALRARFFSLFLSFSQCNFTEKMPFFREVRTPRLARFRRPHTHLHPQNATPAAAARPPPPRLRLLRDHRVADRRPARRLPLCADQLCARSVAAARRRGAQAGRGALRAGVRVGGRGDADLDRRQRLGAGLGLLLQAAEAAQRASCRSSSTRASSRVPPRGRRGGRAAVSAAASSSVRLVSLFVYSSLFSCAASWAAWRGGGCLFRSRK